MCSFERYTLYFYLFEISYCCTIHQIQLGSKWVKLCAPKEKKKKKIILENNLFYSDRLMFYHWLNVLACIVYCIQWFNLSFFYSIKNYTTLFQKLEQKNPIEFNAEYYSLFIPFFFHNHRPFFKCNGIFPLFWFYCDTDSPNVWKSASKRIAKIPPIGTSSVVFISFQLILGK